MSEERKAQDAGRGARKGFNRESIKNVLIVAVSLSLVCSVLVSATAVILKPMQERNEALNMKKNVLLVAGLLEPGIDIEERFGMVETHIVDLATGEYHDEIDPAGYDMIEAANDPAMSVDIPAAKDIAGIGRRAKYAEVYVLRDEAGGMETVILPVYGMGLWSTMYGFIALGPDGSTVQALKFYKHAETPGLGGEVDNEQWLANWPGKRIYDEEGDIRIRVAKGTVGAAAGWTGATARGGAAIFQVDGISGSTLTSRGVTNLLHYWMSDDAYRPYLEKVWRRSVEQS
ncbi:Na(+)-translocating NADH-quinone reductase subunit C [Lentisalinibacter salinarum]|uniref:Na(+)-translocating NADH-quinone reductase subunit C n=1 Tax=Lentisalinibacter salinarum TaxID=2992239 RepID=UPI003865E2AB